MERQEKLEMRPRKAPGLLPLIVAASVSVVVISAWLAIICHSGKSLPPCPINLFSDGEDHGSDQCGEQSLRSSHTALISWFRLTAPVVRFTGIPPEPERLAPSRPHFKLSLRGPPPCINS